MRLFFYVRHVSQESDRLYRTAEWKGSWKFNPQPQDLQTVDSFFNPLKSLLTLQIYQVILFYYSESCQ
jgi:hypothetical protein